MPDQPAIPTETTEADIAKFLNSLARWFDGMEKFIAISKNEWVHAPTGHRLMTQTLGRHTRSLKADAQALSIRLSGGPQDGAS